MRGYEDISDSSMLDSDYEETLEATDRILNQYESAVQYDDGVDRALTMFERKAQTENPLLLMTFPLPQLSNYELRCGLSPTRDFSACILLKQKYTSRSISFNTYEWSSMIDLLQEIQRKLKDGEDEVHVDPKVTECGDLIKIYQYRYASDDINLVSVSKFNVDLNLYEEDIAAILNIHMHLMSDRLAMLEALNFNDYYRNLLEIVKDWLNNNYINLGVVEILYGFCEASSMDSLYSNALREYIFYYSSEIVRNFN